MRKRINKEIIKNSVFASFSAIICCALWGISTPIVKMGYAYVNAKSIPSLLLWVGIQFALGGALTLFICNFANKGSFKIKFGDFKGIALISLFQTILQYICLYIGLSNTTAVKGAVIKSTDVFFIMIISSLIFKQEKLTLKKIIACAIGFFGILVMNLDGLSLDINLKGDIVVLLGIVFYSFAVVLTKNVSKNIDPIFLCGSQMLLGGIIMMVIGFAFGGTLNIVKMLPIIIILSLIYAISYSLWTLLLKHHPASKVAIFSFMTPLLGVVFSALLINEEIGASITNLLIALVLVCSGIILWSTNQE